MADKTAMSRFIRGLGTLLFAFGVGLIAVAALLALYLGVMWLRLPSVAAVGDGGDPGPTAFMRGDACAAADIQRTYVPLSQIDPRLACTVIWSEDWRFFRHDGVDVTALKGALRTNWKARSWRLGGSTIAMQLARNLFLSRSRTLSRKLEEIILARRLVARYDKLRLLEVYLNAAEWAPCVYGVEAAARHYFGHGARILDPGETTFLAAMLPRPGIAPGRTEKDRAKLARRQHQLLLLLRRAGVLSRDELRVGRVEISAAWGNKWANHRARVSHPGAKNLLKRYCGSPP